MLQKFNTICRLIIVGLLIYPLPVFAEDVPNEVTINEDFQDSTYQDGLTVSDGTATASFIYTNEQNQYGTTGCSLAITSGTYVLDDVLAVAARVRPLGDHHTITGSKNLGPARGSVIHATVRTDLAGDRMLALGVEGRAHPVRPGRRCPHQRQ